MKKDLGNDNISKLLLELSIPAILSMLVAALYNIVDRIFVGNTNPLGLTAIGITMPFQIVQMAFVLLIGVGSATLISIKYGENKKKSAEDILLNALILIVIAELIVTVICIAFIDPIFSLLGVSESVYDLAKQYIIIILLGGVPGLTGYCLNNAVRSMGFSKHSMFFVLFSSILNIILDGFFILVLGWGVKGAAIATVISQIFVTIFVIDFFIRNKDVPIKLNLNRAKLKLETIKEIFLIGLPNFYMQIFGTVFNIILNRFIIAYGGDYQLASVTIITSVSMVFTMVIYGISQGAQPIIGYNYGAKKQERCLETLTKTLASVTVFSMFFLFLIELFPHFLVKFFTEDVQLLNITSNNIRIFLFAIPFVGIHSVGTTYFQTTKRPKISSILYILKYGAILIPLLYIIPRFAGINGVYISNALSELISGTVALILIILDIRKIKKQLGRKIQSSEV
ncbi:MATE family efflux transporter [Peptostreptococcus faecalis]|uniref:MATE family efflux transporter n=1 Tax=Peptostreptococcus faecalis TaxID=2045015 RepID=UPI000C7B8D81|nr:MATE family efflux transporter [Peptostreptococcus faecalis]